MKHSHFTPMKDKIGSLLDLIMSSGSKSKALKLHMAKQPSYGSETTQFEKDADVEEKEQSHLPPDIEPKQVQRFFKFLFAALLFMNADVGILPACTVKMQQEFRMDNGLFGTMGSVVYLGPTFGAMCSTYILQRVPMKTVLVTCLAANILTLLVFTVSFNLYALLLCRMLTGFS